ncbi:ABC transporter ATP-binding protein [Salinarimonas soli]|uniref:ABC transporter ATP-binding protein n=1 Tax=Salinarimonas soli TaxID=1638099 RepID=A0A5B2V9H7_9HYPH|nr:ABC transporter ATP-binding protein [Salinarimonas soli]KAA2235245.1 ABC transporter ATP-binding protein [Salinarimonas soli]
MTIALRVENLGKLYAINQAARGTTLRDQLARGVNRLLGRGSEAQSLIEREANENAARPRDFWALRDVSFEVEEGERVGIIGANGAGKSTLLKILSRITPPTEGRIEIHGRVASLLEVGTGFHPELSGRENVYLNGAVLGMSRGEIARKFDQIVDFSGVEKFIDTPVKHYSSGMYVRLAFSVSAWLDPDILIVDEVLSVGDQAFQKKCEERMRELTREGRTVLFVSHSLATVNQMCKKALYLEEGRALSYGVVEDLTREYNRDVVKQIEVERVQEHGEDWRWHRARFSLPDPQIETLTDHPGAVECLGGEAVSPDGEAADVVPIDKQTHLVVHYRVKRDLPRPLVPTFNVYDELGTIVFVAMPEALLPGRAGDYEVRCVLPAFLLNEGRFTFNANLSDFEADKTTFCAVVGAFRLEVQEVDVAADRRRHGYRAPLPGFTRPRLSISVCPAGAVDRVNTSGEIPRAS